MESFSLFKSSTSEFSMNLDDEMAYVYFDKPHDMVDPFHSNENFLSIILTHAITFIVGIIGNSLVIATWARGGKIRSPTATFLVSLACADLLLLVIFLPLETLEYFVITWDYNGYICKLSSFVELLSGTSSILNLVAVSAERYLVIVYPMRARRWCTVTKSRRLLFFVWGLAVLFAFPPIFNKSIYSMTYYNNETSITAYYCFEKYDNWTVYVAVYELMILFVIPAFLMVLCYFRVIRELWTSNQVITILTSRTLPNNMSSNSKLNKSIGSKKESNNQSYMFRWSTRKFLTVPINDELSNPSSLSNSSSQRFSSTISQNDLFKLPRQPPPSPNISFNENFVESEKNSNLTFSIQNSLSNFLHYNDRIEKNADHSKNCLERLSASTQSVQKNDLHINLNIRGNSEKKIGMIRSMSDKIETKNEKMVSIKSTQFKLMKTSVNKQDSDKNKKLDNKIFNQLKKTSSESHSKSEIRESSLSTSSYSEIHNQSASYCVNMEDRKNSKIQSLDQYRSFYRKDDRSRKNSKTNKEQQKGPTADFSVNSLSYKTPVVSDFRNARQQLYCQIIKMLLFVVILFHVCWGPRLIFNVMKSAGLIQFDNIAYSARVCFYLLSFIHSALNPFVYGFMSSNFRRMMAKSCSRHYHSFRQHGNNSFKLKKRHNNKHTFS